VIGFTESIVHEGPRTVTDHILSMKKYGALVPPALICKSLENIFMLLIDLAIHDLFDR
jgi:hypothetical protein